MLIHDVIVDESGGLTGIHDEKLLRSALARPSHSAFGKELYVDHFMKAAALLDSLANNHGFRDGNKRTAMAAAVLFLHLHNVTIQFSNEEYETFMLYVVLDKPSLQEIRVWLSDHTI